MSRTLAALLVIVLSPLLLFLMIFLYACQGQPIFFNQERIGKGGKTFVLHKFRTMMKVNDDFVITPLGKFLRSTGLDELPQLLNIIKGEMAFVGPRPLPVSYLRLFSYLEERRHLVLPGITGLAQIKGRNSLEWEDKFYWDVQYVKNKSFTFDLLILIKTIRVLGNEGGTMKPLDESR